MPFHKTRKAIKTTQAGVGHVTNVAGHIGAVLGDSAELEQQRRAKARRSIRFVHILMPIVGMLLFVVTVTHVSAKFSLVVAAFTALCMLLGWSLNARFEAHGLGARKVSILKPFLYAREALQVPELSEDAQVDLRHFDRERRSLIEAETADEKRRRRQAQTARNLAVFGGLVMLVETLVGVSGYLGALDHLMASLAHVWAGGPAVRSGWWLGFLLGFWALEPWANATGRLVAMRDTGTMKTLTTLELRVARVFGEAPNSWASNGGKVKINIDGSLIVTPSASGWAKFTTAEGAFDVRRFENALASSLEDYALRPNAGHGFAAIELIQAAHEDAAQAVAERQTLNFSGGLFRTSEGLPDAGNWSSRARFQLAAGMTPEHLEKYLAQAAADTGTQRLFVESVSTVAGDTFAIAGLPTEATYLIRQSVAEELRAIGQQPQPWLVDVATAGVERDTFGRITKVAKVRIKGIPFSYFGKSGTRAENVQMFAARHLEKYGFTTAWNIEEIDAGIVCTFRAPLVLPPSVDGGTLLPASISPDEWSRPLIGVGTEDRLFNFALRDNPHLLVAGPTGSGKSTFLNMLSLALLTRGWEVMVADASSKRGADFKTLAPYLSAFVNSLESTESAIRAAYAEGARRSELLEQYPGVTFWADLPADVRAAENIRPLMVIIDEFAAMMTLEEIPSTWPKDSILRIEAEKSNEQRTMIRYYAGRIAQELRFVGIHLCLAMQEPRQDTFGSGSLRGNLGSRVQLRTPNAKVAQRIIEMALPGESVEASEILDMLDDKKNRGLAVASVEGIGLAGFRFGFVAASDLPAVLDAHGVPHAVQRDLSAADPAQDTAPEFEVIRRQNERASTAAPEVVEVGSMDLSLDDLEEEPLAPAPAPRLPMPAADRLDDLFASAARGEPSE